MADSKPKKCSDCQGRGYVSFATEDVKCSACDGKGTVSSG